MIAGFRARLATATAHPVAFWARVAIAAYAAYQLFGVRAQPRLLLLLAAFIPLVLLLIEPQFRRRQLAAARGLWADLSRPAPEWRSWLAGVVFLAAPAAVHFFGTHYYRIDSGDTWAAFPTAASIVREGNVPALAKLRRSAPGRIVPALVIAASAAAHLIGVWVPGIGANWPNSSEAEMWRWPYWPALDPLRA